VVDRLILETTFLVDLERELLASSPGAAHRFLEANPDSQLFITFTIAGELAAGPRIVDRSRWEQLLAPFEILSCSPEVSWRYGRLHRYLKENGLLIAANDLWIAATALAHDLPLVTRNSRHFARVPDLSVLAYD
jgi:tRNA(fMet)-specific endonuclease VapC